tara:strand:- start:4400 stop:4867 length:468 start_codon:yes stop_codon:yes gene_type:complete
MFKSATSSITKQFQKQQILSVFTGKYMELLNIFDNLLVNNNDIKTIINMTGIIKKTNPSLMIKLWNISVTQKYNIEIEEVNNGEYSFWLNNDFNKTFDEIAKDDMWNELGKIIVVDLQNKIKTNYNSNEYIKMKTDNMFNLGYEINKLSKLYYSL